MLRGREEEAHEVTHGAWPDKVAVDRLGGRRRPEDVGDDQKQRLVIGKLEFRLAIVSRWRRASRVHPLLGASRRKNHIRFDHSSQSCRFARRSRSKAEKSQFYNCCKGSAWEQHASRARQQAKGAF